MRRLEVDAAAFGLDNDIVSAELSAAHRTPVRNLRAARMESKTNARSIEGCLGHNFDMHYLDGRYYFLVKVILVDEHLITEQTHRTSSQFAALVRVSAKLPTIVIEEVEHHISEITCDADSISLKFESLDMAKAAYDEFSSVKDFFAVTSHEGCNNEGERNSYRCVEKRISIAG